MYSLVLVSIYLVSTATWLATDHTRHYTKAEVEYPLHNVLIVQLVAQSTKTTYIGSLIYHTVSEQTFGKNLTLQY